MSALGPDVCSVDAASAWLVQHAPDYMYVLGPDGTVRFANRVDPPLSIETVIGSNAARYVGGDPQRVLLSIARIIDTGVEEEHGFSISLGGQTRWYVAKMKRGGTQGAPVVLLFVAEVTQQREAEEALKAKMRELEESRRQMAMAEKIHSIGRLAGGVAHDFNNLLTVIISFTRFVMDDLGSQDPRRADLVEVLKAADSASKLTRQLLAFSSQQSSEPLLTNLNTSTTRFARVLQRTLPESIHMRIVESPEPVYVMSDPGKLDQMVMNLTVNARDAMPTGGSLTIEIGRRTLDQHDALPAGEYALLSVTDTGTGMSPEIVSQIFEPFFSTKGERGTGLGLATCYGLAKQANGHIDVESHAGLGSKFTVLLPLVAEPARQASVAPVSPSGRSAASSVVLLVEDQAAIRRSMSRSLQRAGFNVIDAQSAEEALAMLEDLKTPLDLLVTDIVLPGLDGIQLALRLRARQPKLRVLVCSGYAGDAHTAALPVDERTAFLPKPFTGAELTASAAALFA